MIDGIAVFTAFFRFVESQVGLSVEGFKRRSVLGRDGHADTGGKFPLGRLFRIDGIERL